ncbi:hypothetical protein KUTeg_023153 [Tegillarca granosa]|uniref:NSFL1 cofactor p47 n=1 Tax=Tegillarca granosa TaxID=220873 RepID=A0ABQ9E0U2_TEGGR|nr:hypothetical protein KUTeg_023153 [Tegillarca granosa]
MADQNAKTEMIKQFKDLTGVPDDRAKFYLELAAWNVELAVASYYENMGEDDIVDADIAAPAQTSPPPASKGQSSSSRFATIHNIQDAVSSDSENEEGQAFYAGGSETSGQQILGPKKKQTGKKIVEDLFKSAREHGATEVDESEPQRRTTTKPTFKGTGYRLGETEDMPNDGPLRDFKDPENREFLDSISKGEVPRELTSSAKGEVNLNMEDHRQEEYVKPKIPVKAFAGAGHMLGSPAPNVIQQTPSAASGSANESAAQSTLSVDNSKPTTSLQIRLADGSRMVAKFNHSHRVLDVRRYIIIARPQYAGVNFVLMTTFPNKELTDENQTLEEAKLLNAVIK